MSISSLSQKAACKTINISFESVESDVECQDNGDVGGVVRALYHRLLLDGFAGPENEENLNKYAIYSGYKTFKAFINCRLEKGREKCERESNTRVNELE